ncbi:MAG: EamA family transporter [Leptolyngbya sp. RL_3_1]|nr:EamA family transporter [Leptolyngbya sp. RL_3_1]
MDNELDTSRDARDILRDVAQDLRGLQAQLNDQLGQDIDRLQLRKQQLLSDLDMLEEEYQDLQKKHAALQSNHEVTLSQQQLAQQQLWAKRLAQSLATHLKTRLTESIQAAVPTYAGGQPPSLDNAYQLLASLDSSLSGTLRSLQQDLTSYQSTLSQQISRMHSMEQQGEVILEALINRLSQQLQTQMMRPPGMASLPTTAPPLLSDTGGAASFPASASGPQLQGNHWQHLSTPLPSSIPSPLPSPRSAGATAAASATHQPRATTGWQRGLVCMILATVAIALHNVWVGGISSGQLVGAEFLGSALTLGVPQVLMLLWLRMLVVLPVIGFAAPRLYPEVWRDLAQLFTAPDRRPLFHVLISGVFLFISQVLIYQAIATAGAGVAITLLFTYPLLTVPLAWFLFGDRPSPLKMVVMVAVAMGVVFTVLPRLGSGGVAFTWGVIMALIASGAFALYMIAMQLSSRRLHPVSVNIVQFTTLFVLSGLLFSGAWLRGAIQGVEIGTSNNSGLLMGGIALGILTLIWYLFNTYGVRLIGAAQAALVAAAVPMLTAIIAVNLTPAASSLHFLQWIGVAMVTLGTVAFSAERLHPSAGVKPRRVRA